MSCTRGEELKRELDRVRADREIGIVLLTEKFGRDFPDLVNDLKLCSRVPLFVRDSGQARGLAAIRILLRIMSIRRLG